jgi:hypothetical protein
LFATLWLPLAPGTEFAVLENHAANGTVELQNPSMVQRELWMHLLVHNFNPTPDV